jgi:hypothetical protein
MTYTAKQFALGLRNQLDMGYDVKRIADWAHGEYLCHGRSFAPEVQSVVMKIVAMDEGPQFELSEEDIRRLIADISGS